jgi:hypothetical protein
MRTAPKSGQKPAKTKTKSLKFGNRGEVLYFYDVGIDNRHEAEFLDAPRAIIHASSLILFETHPQKPRQSA